MKTSKIRTKCMEAISQAGNTGLLQTDLNKIFKIGSASSIAEQILILLLDGKIVRFAYGNTFRIYVKGSEPVTGLQKTYKTCLYVRHNKTHPDILKGHSAAFRTAWDKTWGLAPL